MLAMQMIVVDKSSELYDHTGIISRAQGLGPRARCVCTYQEVNFAIVIMTLY